MPYPAPPETLVLYFHSPAGCENTAAHLCNIQPYCLLSHQTIYIYVSGSSKIQTLCPMTQVLLKLRFTAMERLSVYESCFS